MQTLAGYKSYFLAAAMLFYAALAVFVLPPPYHLDPDAGIKVAFAALALVGVRSGITTEVQKVLAALGVNVLQGQAATPAAVQAQAAPLVQALKRNAPAILVAFLFAPILFGLSGCGSLGSIFGGNVPAPKTPAQTVYTAKGYFAASLVLADEYATLPTCPEAAPICKTAAILATVQRSAHATKDSLDAAQDIVDNPAWKTDKWAASAAAALAAAQAFQSVTADLKVK